MTSGTVGFNHYRESVFVAVCGDGNYMLVIALLVVPSSVQYPMVTGGVMIVSTLACFLMKNRPSKRELISVAVAFVAFVILVLPGLDIKLFCI